MLKHIHSPCVLSQGSTENNRNRITQPPHASSLSTLIVPPSGNCIHDNSIKLRPSCEPTNLMTSNNKRKATTTTNNNILSSTTVNINKGMLGAREALTSLGLLCIVSLLLALLSLTFLLKISPGSRDLTAVPVAIEDYAIVYNVTLVLCAISLSLNLSCLFVCAIQFLFAVKLVRIPTNAGRDNNYLQKSSCSRICAVSGFFISIPIFLTGVILYSFIQFHATPAMMISILIGFGIVFCGAAMVHNVFVWQREKTVNVQQTPLNFNLTLTPRISAVSQSTQSQYQHLNQNNGNVTPMTPTTPVSGNSHFKYNQSYMPMDTSVLPETTTPPTTKVNVSLARNTTRSISPAVMPNLSVVTLDISNLTARNSPHELSTLV